MTQTAFSVRYSHTLGIVAMEGRGFSNPVDLAVSSDGRIYVLSRTNPAQTYGIRIGMLSLDSEYFGDFGSYGEGDGQFVWPVALAFDSKDRLYLSDERNHRITVFDKSGRFLSKWGAHGTADGHLNGPAGIAFDADDNIYVSDHLNHRIQKFTGDGSFLLAWGREGAGPGQLNLPWGLTVDSEGYVYVADWRNDRIQKFAPDGEFVVELGEPGTGDGQFNRPSGVAVDSEGQIYVADWGNERVQVLGPDGAFLFKLRGESGLSKWAHEFYSTNMDEKEARDASVLVPKLTERELAPYDESARIEQYFWGPVSVKLDRDDRLYVTETNRHRVQVYERA